MADSSDLTAGRIKATERSFGFDAHDLDDAMSPLERDERIVFGKIKKHSEDVANYSFCGAMLHVEMFRNLRQMERFIREKIPSPVSADLEARLYKFGRNDDYLLVNNILFILLPQDKNAEALRVVVLTPEALRSFMETVYPENPLTPALLRLLTCYLGGLSLSEGAHLDGKSVDTRKRQAQELRARLGLANEAAIIKMVGGRLLGELMISVDRQSAGDGQLFLNHLTKFFPSDVKGMILFDQSTGPIRLIDMGPVEGDPVIVLHPMVLPDIRAQDLALLHELNLRLIWPLRNGMLASNEPVLSPEDHMKHALSGIEAARRLVGPRATCILSFAASSKIALTYARTQSDAVKHLIFAAACVLEERPDGGERKLAKGMVQLSRSHPQMMFPVLSYMKSILLTKSRFKPFIRQRFASCTADREILEEELEGPNKGERMRNALAYSVGSILHDYAFQADLEWQNAAALNVRLSFLHGANDDIHPPELIEKLTRRLGSPPVSFVPGAGQLLYYQHFRAVAEHVARVIHAA